MKVSVCASLSYFYDVEIPDELCERDNAGYLKNEAELVNTCIDADPLIFSGVFDNVCQDIVSIYTEDNKELYVS